MEIYRQWSMPNKCTFDIKPIKEFIYRHIESYAIKNPIVIDAFANNSKIANITNDLDPQYNTDYHLDAIEFYKIFENDSVDIVLFDPPYSPRQVSESYKKLGYAVNMQTTQSSYWRKLKIEIARIVKPNGLCLSFGWNSGGVGKKRGFEIQEILLVPHGGHHNDTICVMEQKIGEMQ